MSFFAFFDRGPTDGERMGSGGSWSVYWYNGAIVSSEIARGLDILKLEPSKYLSANEIAAAKSVKFDHFNVQGQQMLVWPATYSLALAYVDQLDRSGEMPAERAARMRSARSCCALLWWSFRLRLILRSSRMDLMYPVVLSPGCSF